MSERAQHPRVSVAVPVFNEEETLPELLRRLTAVLDALDGGPHEMVFVDDGSSDRTAELLREGVAADPRVVVVSLSRNFGHQSAMTAALDHVTGEVTVAMDGDLQDTPETIPKFLEEYRKGYDVVYARRVLRKEGWWLRASYFVFYRLMALFSDIALPVDAGDFGMLSRRVLDRIREAPEHQRYLRGLRTWVGFRQTGIDVERSERHAGRSKYGSWKLIKLALDGIFAFSIVPLRAAVVTGAVAAALSVAFALYAVYARLFLDRSPQGFTAIIVVMVFLSGVNLFFLGVIGEYVGRIYEEAKARPLYIVEGVTRAPSSTSSAPR